MPKELQEALNACSAANDYSTMYAALERSPALRVDLDGRHLSHALFFQLCKIKYAAWRYRVNFKRARRHSLAEVFQDLVAFYLRAALPPQYEVCLEEPRKIDKGGKIITIQPDICIKLNGRAYFVIEAKTTIGWARPDFQQAEEICYKHMQQRIDDIAEAFGIAKENVIFIFEEPTNVSTTHFLPKFWDSKMATPVTRPAQGVLSHIYPLYMTTDPSYWNWKSQIPKGRKTADWFIPEFSDELVLGRARQSVVTPFENILALIQSRSLAQA